MSFGCTCPFSRTRRPNLIEFFEFLAEKVQRHGSIHTVHSMYSLSICSLPPANRPCCRRPKRPVWGITPTGSDSPKAWTSTTTPPRATTTPSSLSCPTCWRCSWRTAKPSRSSTTARRRSKTSSTRCRPNSDWPRRCISPSSSNISKVCEEISWRCWTPRRGWRWSRRDLAPTTCGAYSAWPSCPETLPTYWGRIRWLSSICTCNVATTSSRRDSRPNWSTTSRWGWPRWICSNTLSSTACRRRPGGSRPSPRSSPLRRSAAWRGSSPPVWPNRWRRRSWGRFWLISSRPTSSPPRRIPINRLRIILINAPNRPNSTTSKSSVTCPATERNVSLQILV